VSVSVAVGFERDLEFNLKNLKCLDNGRFLLAVFCFGDVEHDETPSVDDGGEHAGCCGDDEYGDSFRCTSDEQSVGVPVVNKTFVLLLL
jgi:hypothetical protein